MIYAGRNHMAGSPGCISGEKAGCTQRPHIFLMLRIVQKKSVNIKTVSDCNMEISIFLEYKKATGFVL